MNCSIIKVWFEEERIFVNTNAGETLSQRLEIYPSLLDASEKERNDYYIWNEGQSIRWESVDEDIHIEDLREPDIVNHNNEVNDLLSKFPYLDLKSFAQVVGMHWTKLARFKYGVWKPSEEEMQDIRNGLLRIGKEILEAV